MMILELMFIVTCYSALCMHHTWAGLYKVLVKMCNMIICMCNIYRLLVEMQEHLCLCNIYRLLVTMQEHLCLCNIYRLLVTMQQHLLVQHPLDIMCFTSSACKKKVPHLLVKHLLVKLDHNSISKFVSLNLQFVWKRENWAIEQLKFFIFSFVTENFYQELEQTKCSKQKKKLS